MSRFLSFSRMSLRLGIPVGKAVCIDWPSFRSPVAVFSRMGISAQAGLYSMRAVVSV